MSVNESASSQTHSRKVDALLAHYRLSHMHPVNETIHFVAVPVIMFCIIGLLYAWNPYIAYGFLLASMTYYWFLGAPKLMLLMGLISALMLLLAHVLGDKLVPVCVTLFVVAWIFQFIGHKVEGKKPSFFEDVRYLWVGPLFVVTQLYKKMRKTA